MPLPGRARLAERAIHDACSGDECQSDLPQIESTRGYTGSPSGAGQNFEMVDEALPDHSDYVTGTNTGDRDSYAFQPLPAMNTPSVLGVQVTALAQA